MEIKGDFEAALYQLIHSLAEEKQNNYNPFIIKLLNDWNYIRGNDWFTSTKKWEEQSEGK